jgi:hypothetical protein
MEVKMKTKILLLFMLAALLPVAQGQTQWRLEAFLEYFGNMQGTSLGARVKGFVGSRPNNPYNVAVAEGYNPIIQAPRLRFYHIASPEDTTPRWIIPGGANVEHGDFNSDGLTDFAVWKTTNAGYGDTVLVYLGNTTDIDTIPAYKLPAEQAQSGFGSRMCVGDLNNDGFDDLVVTAPGYYVSLGNNNGKVYVYFGGTTLKLTPDFMMAGNNHGAGLGTRCAIGDFNNDGFNDLAVRGYYQSGTGVSYGYLDVYFGSVQIDTIADLTSTRASTAFLNDDLAAFDVNGDQQVDLLWTFADSSQRSVFIHYGGSDFQQRFQTRPDFVIHGLSGSGLFGSELCNAGDMNGDGDNDIAIGAYATGQGNGIVFIYTAGKALDDRFDAARGQTLEGAFGRSISNVGDINHDGLSDILIGAPTQPWSRSEGYFGIFLGDSRIPTSVESKNENTPSSFTLRPGYPNPFSHETIFEFSLLRRALIEMKVFDILGREVKSLLIAEHDRGQYKLPWDGKDEKGEAVPNGIYFCRIRVFTTNGSLPVYIQTQKFTVVR